MFDSNCSRLESRQTIVTVDLQLKKSHVEHHLIIRTPHILPLIVNSISLHLYKPLWYIYHVLFCLPLNFCPFSVPLCFPKLANI